MNFNNFLNEIQNNNVLKFHQYKKGERQSLSAESFFYKIEKVSCFFNELLNNKDRLKVITIIENSVEWNIFDFGLSLLSSDILYLAINPTIENNQLNKIIKKVKPDYIIVSELVANLRKVQSVNNEKILLTSSVINYSSKKVNTNSSVNTNGMTYFLTSGTTGEFKIIEHTQDFIYNNIKEAQRFYNFSTKQKALSVLPIHYAFERMYNYMFQLSGLEIFYADINKSLVENFITIRPDYACIVPALLEDLIKEDKKLTPFLNYVCEVSPMLICSGAGIDESLRNRLNKLDLKVYEMYGSTETLIVSANNKLEYRASTSGKVLKPKRVKINENKELLIKTSYIKHVDFTENTTTNLDNDWHKTGDLAELNDGFLKIIGRDSIFFKNAFGLFINPNKIEKEIKKLDIVKNVIIFGKNEKHINCILELRDISKKHEKEVISFLLNYNKSMEDSLKVKRYYISKNWSHKTGEKTLSYKLRRDFIIKKYENDLKNLI